MLLIDNNLSFKLTALFNNKKVVAKHVYGEGLDRAKDSEVWDFAKKSEYTILTKDSDFLAIQNIQGFPPKIILLKCGNASTQTIADILENSWIKINEFLKKDELGIIEVS